MEQRCRGAALVVMLTPHIHGGGGGGGDSGFSSFHAILEQPLNFFK